MTKAQKKRRLEGKKKASQLRALRKKESVQAEIEAQEEEELDEEMDMESEVETPSEEQEEGEQEIQKDMSVYPESASSSFPTSFEELDDEREAREQARAVEEVTWDLKQIVSNILYSTMDPDEKVSSIKEAADAFGERVEMEIAEVEEEKKDVDLLQIEALMAQDGRHETIVEKTEDLAKRVLSYASRKKLPTSKFALPSKRKYPIHDKAHVRNALSRAAQQIKRGGEGAADAKAALPKIRAAAKRMGIGQPAKKDRSAILIEKDANNDWRWVGWVSNNFIDWDGDIISEAAHKEYVEWWEKNKDLSPVFVSWHTPGTARTAPVDFMTYENGFLIMSGKLEEVEATALLKMQKECDLGMSHGTFAFSRDPNDPRVITKYRMYEASDLPLENAANPFTDFETVAKEADNMDQLAYLTQILGSEEKAKAFMTRTGVKQKELQEAGIESKEQKPTELPAAPPTEVKPEVIPPVVDENALIEKVMKALDAEGLSKFVEKVRTSIEKVPVLEALVKELQTGQDQKIAEALTPPAARFAWSEGKRASQSDDTVIDEKDKLKKNAPGVPSDYWLSEISGTVPLKTE